MQIPNAPRRKGCGEEYYRRGRSAAPNPEGRPVRATVEILSRNSAASFRRGANKGLMPGRAYQIGRLIYSVKNVRDGRVGSVEMSCFVLGRFKGYSFVVRASLGVGDSYSLLGSLWQKSRRLCVQGGRSSVSRSEGTVPVGQKGRRIGVSGAEMRRDGL